MDFLPTHDFNRCVRRYRGDFRVRYFSCRDQFLCMACAQLNYRESLRDIETGLRALRHKLSASTVTRLKEAWEQEFAAWQQHSLAGRKYVYLWADGVYFNLRLEEDRVCVLVLMGATADGTKELIAVSAGYRESE